MNNQITLTLPNETYQQAQHLAQLTNCAVDELLADALELVLAPVRPGKTHSQPVEELSDKQVLALTKLQLPEAQDKRLSRLLDRQQAGKLMERERGELLALMQAYQKGLLRKAQALREAVRRELIPPLQS